MSTKKGWKEVTPPDPTADTYAKLAGTAVPDLMGIQWKLVFDETVDAFAPPPAGEAGEGNSCPMLRLTLRQLWNPNAKQFTMLYPPLADLLLVTAFLKVEVAGLKTLSLANDETTLDPKKPFLPFGSRPTSGARFFVGHPEIVAKKLDSLTFNLEWLGAPKELWGLLRKLWRRRPDKIGPFTASISLTDKHANRPVAAKAALFANTPTDPCKIPLSFTRGQSPARVQLRPPPRHVFRCGSSGMEPLLRMGIEPA